MLVGHDPWKPDEAYSFGLVLDQLERGDWVVPMLAGELSSAIIGIARFPGPLVNQSAARLHVYN